MANAKANQRLGYLPCADTRPPKVACGRRIRSSINAYEAANAEIGGLAQEAFLVLLLNSKHQVIRPVITAVGTLASVDVHPRETFREAVRHSAAAVIVAHNHPSGDAEPSGDDLALTARLRDAGNLLGIPVLDHIIVGDERFVSLADRGLL